jgi:hypothetical protein
MPTLADDTRLTDRLQGAVALNTDAALTAAASAAQNAINNYFGLPASTAISASAPVTASPKQEKTTLKSKVTLAAVAVAALAAIVYVSR